MSVEWLLERSDDHAQRLLIVGGNLLVVLPSSYSLGRRWWLPA